MTRCQLNAPGFLNGSKQRRLDKIEAAFQAKKETCEADGFHEFVNRRCRKHPDYAKLLRQVSRKTESARRRHNASAKARRARKKAEDQGTIREFPENLRDRDREMNALMGMNPNSQGSLYGV